MFYRYLTDMFGKAAKLFEGESKKAHSSDSSPVVDEDRKSFNAGQKRKLNESPTSTPAKRAKTKDSEDSSDSASESDEVNVSHMVLKDLDDLIEALKIEEDDDSEEEESSSGGESDSSDDF